MSARQILETAYKQHLVPSGLYGETQHKTLGARLSEDILLRKDRSAFFRTEPGRFFLRELLSDPNIPYEHKQPILARRRRRELYRGRSLAVPRSQIPAGHGKNVRESIFKAFSGPQSRYVDHRDPDVELMHLWSLAVVCRNDHILTYRPGRYKHGNDSFERPRSVGFCNLVVSDDVSLFDADHLGLRNSSINALYMDLDLPNYIGSHTEYESSVEFLDFIVDEDGAKNVVIGLVRFSCPEWLEPVRRRLALNDLTWVNIRAINHLEDFDSWSRLALSRLSAIG